ncbi:MAG: hypothetical protein AB9880_11695 [Christensenellales bacterium]
MTKRLTALDYLTLLIILLLMVTTITGLTSFNTSTSYLITNQYGQDVRIFGYGIYAHDSYFKAPILIGSDLAMLLFAVPALMIALIRKVRRNTIGSRLFHTSILATALYYAASLAFGVAYNAYHLIYTALFACSLFAFIASIRKIDLQRLGEARASELPSKGLSVFLIVSGIALLMAWLPDILPTVIARTPLPLIEVYTTEITYVLDMGIISPAMFISLYLLRRGDGLGDVILASMLTLCVIMGVMLPVQTMYQTLAGIGTPVPVLITKVGVFVVLAAFAAHFSVKLFRNLSAQAGK